MMRPHTPSSLPPANAEELLRSLRAARLLSARRAAALARRWAVRPPTGDCEARVEELVAAGLLTRYQANQVLAGKARRLRLGDYRVLEKLGGGGMGQVYKAEHVLMRRIVALKVIARLPRRRAGEPLSPAHREAIVRFRREVRAAGRLSHPNIVAAYAAGIARGVLYLVMEYVEGVDLGRFVAQHGPLPVPLACEAVRQAALALQYAHDRGLVHRDIKPDNLLLTWPGAAVAPLSAGSLPSLPDGTSGEGAAVVKLLDLGLAWPLPMAHPTVAVEDADPAGTPDYMAPEHSQGRGPVDVRSDLYSLGCTFYWLLTGRVPYPGGSWTEKLLRHRLELPCAVQQLRPDVPPAIAAIVERLMAKRAEQRYPSPAAVAAVLWGLAERGWCEEAPRCAALDPRPTTHASEPSLPDMPPQELPPAALHEPIIMPPPRRSWLPPPAAVLSAAVAGLILAVAVRWMPAPTALPATDFAAPSLPAPTPFRVERLGHDFATLAEALVAARDGDTVIVATAGPHRLAGIDLTGKALTLRAAAGVRPRLEPRDPEVGGPWQALLTADRALTLEGLDLRTSGDAPLVCALAAPLCLTDCRLTATGGPALVARGGALTVRSSRVAARGTALAVEVMGSACPVTLVGNAITASDRDGVGLALWSAEAAAPAGVHLCLDGNQFQTGRVASFRALAGALSVEAKDNDFTFREALFSFAGYADAAAWRRAATWQGRDNRYHAAGPWVRMDGRPVAVYDLAGWQRLWGNLENGSRQEASARPAAPR